MGSMARGLMGDLQLDRDDGLAWSLTALCSTREQFRVGINGYRYTASDSIACQARSTSAYQLLWVYSTVRR